jgi:cell division protein FtsZ
MALSEISDAANTIYDAAGSEANVIFGTAIDETLSDEIRVTVIATGIGKSTTEERSVLREHTEPGRINNSFLQRAFKRRDIPEVDTETRVSVDACLDVDYETPAFMRRHSD